MIFQIHNDISYASQFWNVFHTFNPICLQNNLPKGKWCVRKQVRHIIIIIT